MSYTPLTPKGNSESKEVTNLAKTAYKPLSKQSDEYVRSLGGGLDQGQELQGFNTALPQDTMRKLAGNVLSKPAQRPQAQQKSDTVFGRYKDWAKSTGEWIGETQIGTTRMVFDFLRQQNAKGEQATVDLKNKISQGLMQDANMRLERGTITPEKHQELQDKYKTYENYEQYLQETPLMEALNSEQGKKVITTIAEKSDNLPLKGIALVQSIGDKTYEEAMQAWIEAKEDPNNPAWKKFLYELQGSGVQSTVITLLGVATSAITKSATAGTAVSGTLFAALSANEQIQERGQVESIGNIAIDTMGDVLLGNMLTSVFAKGGSGSLIKTFGKSFLVEGTTESAQSLLKYANDYRNADSDEEAQAVVARAKEYVRSGDIVMEFLVGGVAGGITGTIVEGTAQYLNRKTEGKVDVEKTKKRINNAQAFDIDRAIDSGDVDASLIYADPVAKVLQPEFAQGRLDDVAQKLDMFKEGLGAQLRQEIDVENTTLDKIITRANTVLANHTLETGQVNPMYQPKPKEERDEKDEVVRQDIAEELEKGKSALEVAQEMSEELGTPIGDAQALVEEVAQEENIQQKEVANGILEQIKLAKDRVTQAKPQITAEDVVAQPGTTVQEQAKSVLDSAQVATMTTGEIAKKLRESDAKIDELEGEARERAIEENNLLRKQLNEARDKNAETVIAVPNRQKNIKIPIAKLEVHELSDGLFEVRNEASVGNAGYSKPFTGEFASKKEAIEAGLREILKFLKSESLRSDFTSKGREDANRILDTFRKQYSFLPINVDALQLFDIDTLTGQSNEPEILSDDDLEMLREDIQQALEEAELADIVDIISVKQIGSTTQGTQRPDSDIDIKVVYKADVREDDMHNILYDYKTQNETQVNGRDVDFFVEKLEAEEKTEEKKEEKPKTKKPAQGKTDGEPQRLAKELSNRYKKDKDNVVEHFTTMVVELDLAERGERLATPSDKHASGYEYVRKESSFPKYLPKGTRARKVIDKLLLRLDPLNIDLNFKRNERNRVRFMVAVYRELDERASLDNSDIINKIEEYYGLKEDAGTSEESGAGGVGGARRGETTVEDIADAWGAENKPTVAKQQTSALPKTMQAIAQANNFDLTDANLDVEIVREGYMPLHIARINDTQVAIAHTYVQNGDVMVDPEVVFDIGADGKLTARTIQHPPMILAGKELYGAVPIKPKDPFLKMWAQNLEDQGFATPIDKSKEQQDNKDNGNERGTTKQLPYSGEVRPGTDREADSTATEGPRDDETSSASSFRARLSGERSDEQLAKIGTKGRQKINERVVELLESKQYSTNREDYTADDLLLLEMYTGAGGKETAGAEGKGLLSEYYTPIPLVNRVWELAQKHSAIPINKAYEPSVGTGRFVTYSPEQIYMEGGEMQLVSGTIAQILNPDAKIAIGQDFQEIFFNKKSWGQYDMLIGNPPFGDRAGLLKGKGEEKDINRWEEYFIKRGLDMTTEGGVVAYVVNSSFLTKKGSKGKQKIAELGELVGAYRLPENVFEDTSIGTDIVVFRSDPTDDAGIVAQRVAQMSEDLYYTENAEHILGEQKTRKNRFGKEETYVEGTLEDALEKLDQLTEVVTVDVKPAKEQPVIQKPKKKPVEKQAVIDKKEPAVEKIGKKVAKKTASGKMPQVFEPDADSAKIETNSVSVITSSGVTHSALELDLVKRANRDGAIVDITEEEKQQGAQFLSYDPERGYVHNVNYYSGDVAQKRDALVENKQKVITQVGEEQYQKQHDTLVSLIPEQVAITDVQFDPLDRHLMKTQGANGSSIYSMFFNAYRNKMNINLPRGIYATDITRYIDGKQARKGSTKMKAEIAEQANKIFNRFMHEYLDPETQNAVISKYNKEKNAYVDPDFSKYPVAVSNIAKSFRGKPFEFSETQKRGVKFLTNKGSGLIAYGVGVGKTHTLMSATIANMDAGRAKRPLFVVPKSTISKTWIATMRAMFPHKTIVNLDGLQKPIIRKLTKERGADPKGWVKDGEIAVISHQGILQLGLDKEEFADAVQDLKDALWVDKKTKRGEEVQDDTIEEIYGHATKYATDIKITDLGIDHLSVDEVHNFRKVFQGAKAEKDVKGKKRFANVIGGKPSMRAKMLFVLSQYIQRKTGGNVFLASATPFENHATEVYNILSFVARKRMKEMGIFNINDFFAAYANFRPEIEVSLNGEVKTVEKMKSYKNVQQLQKLLREFIDFQVDKTLVRPERKVYTPILPMSPLQLENVNRIQQLLAGLEVDEATGMVTESEVADGAFLKASTYTVANSVSPYFIKEYSPNPAEVTPQELIENSPKVEYAITLIDRLSKDPKTKDYGNFLYMGSFGVDYFGHIKRYIAENTVYTEDQIGIISGQTKAEEREIIKEQFNDGTIKVLIGGDPTKEGIDLQNNGFATINLALGWNPTEPAQVEGRVWRQGNMRTIAPLIYPLVENSGDSMIYAKFEEKGSRINDLFSYNGNVFDVSEIDPEERKLATMTNPDHKAQIELIIKTKALNNNLEAINDEIKTLEVQAQKRSEAERELKKAQERLAELEKNKREGRDIWGDKTTNEHNLKMLGERIKDLKREVVANKGVVDRIDAMLQAREITDINAHIEKSKKEIETITEQIDNIKEELPELVKKYRALREEEIKNRKSASENADQFMQDIQVVREMTKEEVNQKREELRKKHVQYKLGKMRTDPTEIATVRKNAQYLIRTAKEEGVEFDVTVDQAMKLLHTLFTEEEVKFAFTNSEEIVHPAGTAWGYMESTTPHMQALIRVVSVDGMVQSKVIYHEAFHRYMLDMIDPQEKAQILEKVNKSVLTKLDRKKLKEVGYSDEKIAEEWLADDFARYVAKTQHNKEFTSFYERLLDFIRSVIRRIIGAQKVYDDIISHKRPRSTKAIMPMSPSYAGRAFRARTYVRDQEGKFASYADSVVQVTRKDEFEQDEQYYMTIPADQKEQFMDLIDTGNREKASDHWHLTGEMYHLTAKSPAQMEREGFVYAGTMDINEMRDVIDHAKREYEALLNGDDKAIEYKLRSIGHKSWFKKELEASREEIWKELQAQGDIRDKSRTDLGGRGPARKIVSVIKELTATANDIYLADTEEFAPAKSYMDAADMRREDKEKIDTYFAEILKPYYEASKADKEKVNKVLVQGDMDAVEYTDAQLRKTLNAKQIEIYKAVRLGFNTAHEYLLEIMEKNGVDAETLDQFRGERVGYLPHKWKYEHAVKHVVRKKGGGTYTYQMDTYRTEKEARDAIIELAKKNTREDVQYVYDTMGSLNVDFFSEKHLSYQKLESVIKEARTSGEVKDKMLDALRDMIKEKGFGRQYMKRTGTAGYEQKELPKIIADYFSGMSGYITKMEASKQYFEALSEVDARRQPDFYRWLQKMIAYDLGNELELNTLKTASFLYYLANDLSFLLINSTQNFVIGTAELSKYMTGAQKILGPEKYIVGAMKDWATGNITEDERNVVASLTERGRLGGDMTSELMGYKNNPLYNTISSGFNKAMFASASFVEKNVNRVPAFLAARRLLLEQGVTESEANEMALRISDYDIHYRYGKQNRALYERGKTGVIFQFYHYLGSFLYQLSRNIKNKEFAALTRNMMYMTILGGTASLPMAGALKSIFEKIWGVRCEENEQGACEMQVEMSMWEQAIKKGVPSLAGVDLSGRVGVDIFTIGNILENPGDVTNYIGAGGNLIPRIYRGLELAKQQRYEEAMGKLAPDMVGNVFEAYAGYKWGVHTFSGTPLEDQDGELIQYNSWEAIIKATGFTPTRETLAWDAKSREFKLQDEISARRATIRRTIQQYIKEGRIYEAKDLQRSAIESGELGENTNYIRDYAKDMLLEQALEEWQSGDINAQRRKSIENALVEAIYDNPSDIQILNVRKDFAVAREFGLNDPLVEKLDTANTNEKKVQILLEAKEDMGEEVFKDFISRGRSTVRTEKGNKSRILISDDLYKMLKDAD